MNHHSSLMNKHSTHKNPEKTQVLISSWRTFLLMEHPSNDLQGQQLGKSAGRAWPIPHQCLLRTTAHVFGSPGQLVEHPRQKIFSRNRPRGVWVYHQHHFTHDIFVCPFLLPKARWSKQKKQWHPVSLKFTTPSLEALEPFQPVLYLHHTHRGT